MKHTLSISSVVAAALLLLAFTFVPHHHHHDSMFCLVTEHCTPDADAANDDAAGHKDAGGDEMLCIIETNYVVPEVGNELKCKIASFDLHHFLHFFPAVCLRVDDADGGARTLTLHSAYGYLLFYKSVTAGLSNGLRAPPALLS
ncbi:MAG: hypothetical protein LBT78_06975 [Tannerella sp.]|nr:hypothetical protein [Tannerella sp.]